eukprot:GHVU01212661.1.p1 GENE.GHVU01212661.1~~GHVU01212661.1.p1  ORF type:complete len:156 (+),score=6.02 GHVU01212661.1:697-1164(+)
MTLSNAFAAHPTKVVSSRGPRNNMHGLHPKPMASLFARSSTVNINKSQSAYGTIKAKELFFRENDTEKTRGAASFVFRRRSSAHPPSFFLAIRRGCLRGKSTGSSFLCGSWRAQALKIDRHRSVTEMWKTFPNFAEKPISKWLQQWLARKYQCYI